MNQRFTHLLEQAFHESRRAEWLAVAPNPRVGALALKEGHVIGRGHHAAFGQAHAEEMALKDANAWDSQLNRALPGVVDEMVVTLEPCSSTSPTKSRPPCAQHLLDAGVKRLVVGAVDPNPEHAGSAFAWLETHGVEVHHLSTFDAVFAQDNPAFLRYLAHPNRPWVLLKWAASLDGKTAADSGSSQWISGPESRDETHFLRSVSSAVMAGAQTFRKDNPSLNARHHQGFYSQQPLRIICGVDESQAPPDAAIFSSGAKPLFLPPNSETGQVELISALTSLRTDRNIKRLLVEGGAKLHGSLLALGLVDAIVVYEAPLLIGGSHAACLGPSFDSPADGLRLTSEATKTLGDDTRRAFLVAP